MIDFHCHLDLYPKPHQVAAEAQENSVAVLSVTTTPSAFAGTRTLAKDRPMIRTALGLHPELVMARRHELPLFDQLLPTTAFVGEIGLDGSSRFAQARTQQLEVFTHILRSCSDVGGRILSIHSRAAVRQVLDALTAYPEVGTPVMHWFTGSARQAEIAVDRGCWFSIGAPMLTSTKGRDLVALLPRERVLTETDGPFTSADGRPMRPADIVNTVALLAKCWSVSVRECRNKLRANLSALLGRHPNLPNQAFTHRGPSN